MYSEDIDISLFHSYFSVYHLCVIFNNNLLFWNSVIKKIGGHLNTLASFPLWLLCHLSNLQVIFPHFFLILLVGSYLLAIICLLDLSYSCPFCFSAPFLNVLSHQYSTFSNPIFWDPILQNIVKYSTFLLLGTWFCSKVMAGSGMQLVVLPKGGSIFHLVFHWYDTPCFPPLLSYLWVGCCSLFVSLPGSFINHWVGSNSIYISWGGSI